MHLPAPLPVINQSIQSVDQSNQSPTIGVLLLLSAPSSATPSTPAGPSLRQGSDRTYPPLGWSLAEPLPVSVPDNHCSPRAAGTFPPGPRLTEPGRGDGVDVDPVVADLLVALPVGRGLGQRGALAAVAPGDFVHALHHPRLQPLAARGGALQERAH